MQRAAEQRHFRTPALRTIRHGEQLELTDPHEVYTMGLDDLRTAAGLAAARPVSWRFLVRGADGVVLAAAESARAADGEYILAEVNEGPFVTATVGTLAALRADRRLEPTPFIPQLLHVPALYAMALWLHHDGSDDLLVPLAPFPLNLPAGLLMSAADLLGRLRLLAASVEMEPAEGTKGS